MTKNYEISLVTDVMECGTQIGLAIQVIEDNDIIYRQGVVFNKRKNPLFVADGLRMLAKMIEEKYGTDAASH